MTALTDAQLRDQAVTELEKTTDPYPTWVRKGRPSGSHWATAFGLLAQIGRPPSVLHWFSTAAVVNTPIPANAQVDSSSARWVQQLQRAPGVNSIFTNSTDWTTTVVLAPAGTPLATITLEVPFVNPDGSQTSTPSVPFPPGSKVSAGDGHLGIIDTVAMIGYEFQGLDTSSMHAHSMETIDMTGLGMQGVNAISDLDPFVGLIVPNDLNAPLAHRLRCNLPNLAPVFVNPAVRSDGVTSGGVPAGKAWRLSAAAPLPGDGAYGDWLVDGLKRMGSLAGDQGPSLAVYAQSTEDGVTAYKWPLVGLDKSYVQYVEFLA